jgi:OmpA-OmpF porin, OOP family
MKSGKRIFVLAVIALVAMTFLIGCGGKVYAPRDGSAIWYYHPELPEAAKAVEDAEKAGKDKVCPDEFQAAKCRMKEAYRAYWACKTEEGIKMAKEATAMARALCPPPAAVSLTASPSEIEKGKSSTLTMKTSGTVKSAKLDGEEVPVTGATKTVSPTITTTYKGEVTGVGGTQEATATVKVVSPPPPPPAPVPAPAPAPAPAPPPPPPAPSPKVLDKMTLRINFDTDKYSIRAADQAELKKAVDFVKKYPNSQVKIEGHTDSIGTDAYNQKLSERRANAVANYLIDKGACKKADISTVGFGESKPVADNKTDKGRFENRRAEILILEK